MNPKMSIDLAGTLFVDCKGICPNNLVSTRKDWAYLMTQGLPADLLSQRLSSIYSLCGHAHKVCSEMAIAAALDRPSILDISARKKLQTETIREHIHRITLNWPNLIAKSHFQNFISKRAQSSLLNCPALIKTSVDELDEVEDRSRLINWIEVNFLNMPATEWLKNWTLSPENWLNEWHEVNRNWLSLLIQQYKIDLDAIPAANKSVRLLKIHASHVDIMELARKLNDETNFNRYPKWQESCAETGTWTRLNDNMNSEVVSNTLRLAYRLADLVRLSLPNSPNCCGAEWLTMGSTSVTPSEAIAWVEMARGLLIHHVKLDTKGSEARVLSCRTIAPTEWNFHPEGAVAQSIERMKNFDEAKTAQSVNALMATYDPCISFKLIDNPLESSHRENQYA